MQEPLTIEHLLRVSEERLLAVMVGLTMREARAVGRHEQFLLHEMLARHPEHSQDIQGLIDAWAGLDAEKSSS